MSDLIWVAFALAFIIEGIVPFLFPRQWRETIQKIASLNDGQIRFFGLIMACLGLLLLIFLI